MTIDAVALLLSDRSPALRYRALVEVDGQDPGGAEVAALFQQIEESPDARRVRDAFATARDDVRAVSYALCRLAHLGLRAGSPTVDSIADCLFTMQAKNGSWPVGARRRDVSSRDVSSRDGSAFVPMQTALPLRGLAAVGLGTDARAERGYEWLLDKKLDDGSWPTGEVAGQRRWVMGYRRLPRSEGCRTNTTAAVAALVHHPERRDSAEVRAAVELLLQRETRDEWTLGYEVARLVGAEPLEGFITFYTRFDLAFLLDLASRAGVAPDDTRIADLVDFLESRRGLYGLWDHPRHVHLSRWLTLDILASLKRLASGRWVGSDFRTSFQAYPKRRARH